jgi:predicted restriction endonuclease
MRLSCTKCGSEDFIVTTPTNVFDNAQGYEAICSRGHKSYFMVASVVKDGAIQIHTILHYVEDVNIYKEYIVSDAWKEKAKAAKERAGYKCQLCNIDGNDSTLHVHHRTYRNLGHEDDMDLVVLCSTHHAMFHDKTDEGSIKV